MGYNNETGTYEGFIYCITNKINGKKYIGQTIRTIQKRWNEHKWAATTAQEHSKSKYLYTSMRLYGIENFSIQEVLKISKKDKNELLDELNILEKHYIDKYNSLWYQNGYNLVSGGLNGITRGSEVIRYTINGEKVGEFNSFSELARIEKVDISTIERQCKKHLCIDGKTVLFFKNEIFDTSIITYSNQNIIKQYTTQGDLVYVFHNTKEISEKNNYNVNAILRCCRGLSKTSCGYVWRFGDQDFGNVDLKNKVHYQKINAYNLDNSFAKTFNTYKDIMIEHNMKSNPSIYASLNNHNKTCCGYKLYYAHDESQPDKTKIIKES